MVSCAKSPLSIISLVSAWQVMLTNLAFVAKRDCCLPLLYWAAVVRTRTHRSSATARRRGIALPWTCIIPKLMVP